MGIFLNYSLKYYVRFKKNRDMCFKLAVFYNIFLLYDNVVSFYTHDILDVSRVTV
jgi:hypothetical protein